MAKRNVKIDLRYGQPVPMIETSDSIIKKHTELGDNSPLKTINLQGFTTVKQVAADNLGLGNEHKKIADKAFAESDLALGIAKGQTLQTPDTIYYYLALVRDQLLIAYKGREELIEEWGFNVQISESSGPHRGQGSNPEGK